MRPVYGCIVVKTISSFITGEPFFKNNQDISKSIQYRENYSIEIQKLLLYTESKE